MGHIREITLKKGGTRFQADINLNGHPRLTAVFDRKTDRSGKNPLPTKDTLSKRNSLKDPCLKETSSSSPPSSLQQWKKKMLLDGWDEDVCDAALAKYYLQPPDSVQNPRGWLKPVLQSRKDDKEKEEHVKEIHAKKREQEEIARKNDAQDYLNFFDSSIR